MDEPYYTPNGISPLSQEAANRLMDSLKKMASQSCFTTEVIEEHVRRLHGIIVRSLGQRYFIAWSDYQEKHLLFICAKWPMRRIRKMQAYKAVKKYRDAFHDLMDFKRKFGNEKSMGV